MTLNTFLQDQTRTYIATHPQSKALADSATAWRAGVPTHWLKDWATPFPVYVERAKDATLTCVDKLAYDDFCFGDTPSLFGHAREELTRSIATQAAAGMGYMLPTPSANRVATLLRERFGLAYWQVATTASDANRALIRWARAITKRSKILVFDGCYHGMVDDCMVALYDGKPRHKKGLLGQVTDLTQTTKVIPFNDLAALENALKDKDVALVLAEPVMTNCGMIAPIQGYHDVLRKLCTQYGTLLALDETHTISSGLGGYCGVHGLKPDMFSLGKAIAGGIPAAVWGVTADVSARMDAAQAEAGAGSSGIGTTLSGNSLAMAAIETMLTEIMVPQAFAHMLRGVERLARGLQSTIDQYQLPWTVVNVGARIELVFSPAPPQNAEEMRRYLSHDLLAAFHLFLINKGILIAPFHNMMLISPKTDDQAIARLVAAVAEFGKVFKDLT